MTDLDPDLEMMRAQSEASGGSHADYVRAKKMQPSCPFDAGAIGPFPKRDEPCPVCGDLGGFDSEESGRCVAGPARRREMPTHDLVTDAMVEAGAIAACDAHPELKKWNEMGEIWPNGFVAVSPDVGRDWWRKLSRAVLSAAAPTLAESVREECAKIADNWLVIFGETNPQHVSAQTWANDAVADIAAAIRSGK
jgi:hypothetical protein